MDTLVAEDSGRKFRRCSLASGFSGEGCAVRCKALSLIESTGDCLSAGGNPLSEGAASREHKSRG